MMHGRDEQFGGMDGMDVWNESMDGVVRMDNWGRWMDCWMELMVGTDGWDESDGAVG